MKIGDKFKIKAGCNDQIRKKCGFNKSHIEELLKAKTLIISNLVEHEGHAKIHFSFEFSESYFGSPITYWIFSEFTCPAESRCYQHPLTKQFK